MVTMNKVMMAGNLTRDPERREAHGGVVCAFGLAVSEKVRARDGSVRESVVYLDVSVWGAIAESCARCLKRGSGVLVEGKLVQERWVDSTGAERRAIKVRAERVHFLGRFSGGGEAPGENPAPGVAGVPGGATTAGGEEEALPF